ncbi:MAG: hypothetical protein ABSE73_16275 [Planctomycetota bacterium]
MATAGTQFSLVLVGRFAGKDKPVAAALARDFGHDETWGLQIVGAAPITLLDGLSGEQARVVHTALADVEAAGSKMEVRPGTDANLPKVGWPAPPRIRGRPVSDYAAGASGATATLFVPCPYTGQKLKLTISVSVEQVAEQAAVSAAATVPSGSAPAPAPPLPIPWPAAATSKTATGTSIAVAAHAAPAAPSGPAHAAGPPIPVPHPAAATPRPATGTSSAAANKSVPTPVGLPAVPLLRSRPSSSGPVPSLAPMPKPTSPGTGVVATPGPKVEAVDQDLEAMVELRPKAPLQAPQPVAAAARGRDSSHVLAHVPVPGTVPLPDVPVLHNPPTPIAQPATTAAMTGPGQTTMPQDLLSAPMDLAAFEANLSASGIMRALSDEPAQAPREAPAIKTAVASPATDDGGLWSVLMGKSVNPKVHQAVAELRGVSVADAARLCQKPVLALAKDVSVAQARSIKQQFAALNVPVRMTRRG